MRSRIRLDALAVIGSSPRGICKSTEVFWNYNMNATKSFHQNI